MVASLQRSLPDVGEFAHTQLLTAICIGLALPCGEPQSRGRMSDSGPKMACRCGRQLPAARRAPPGSGLAQVAAGLSSPVAVLMASRLTL